MDRKVVGLRQRIEYLHTKAQLPPISDDPELQSDLSRHLCVLTSGLLERWVSAALLEVINRRSSPAIASFASYHVLRLQNAKFEDILTLVRRFDASWSDVLDSGTDPQTRDAISSIVNNRNQIAHGQQVGLSLVAFGEYYKSIAKFLDGFALDMAKR